MTKAQLIAAVDLLIAARDNGANVQPAIDVLMDKIEAMTLADPAFQAEQAAVAWGRACANSAIWN